MLDLIIPLNTALNLAKMFPNPLEVCKNVVRI